MRALRAARLLAAVAAAGGIAGGCAGGPEAAEASYGPPSPWTTIRLDAPGGDLALLDFGRRGGGLTLLGAHGWGGSGLQFAPLAAELDGDLRVLAPDFPGTGASSPPADGRYDMDLFVSVLRRLTEGTGPVVLVGHSLGAKVAAAFAARYPEKVRALVLIAPYGLQGQEGALFRALARHRGLARLAASLNNRLAIRLGRRRVYYDRTRIPGAIMEHTTASQLTRSGRAALAAVTGAMVARDPIDSLLPSLPQPTLILWGREDRVMPSSAAARYAALMPRARLVLLDRCGHVPMTEKPAETARAIEAFLRENGLPAR
jgi:pimeloyl-ACP methyl ester carboxylesterase